MVTVVEVVRLEGDAFAALSLFRLLEWQLTHVESDAGIDKTATVGVSFRGDGDDGDEASLPTAAMLPAQVAARLTAALAAADDEADDS
jgi:hypothetical protein